MTGNIAEHLGVQTPIDPQQIRAIVFDLDGVLIPEDDAIQAAFEATCALAVSRDDPRHQRLVPSVRSTARALWKSGPQAAYCHQIGASSSEGLCATFAGAGPELQVLRAWAPEYRYQVWTSGLEAIGITDSALAARLAEDFPARRTMDFRPYPDVLPTLRRLAPPYRLGLITNGLPDLQRTKLRRAGLETAFSPLVISGEIGVGKPAALAYQHVLDAFGLPAEKILLVENSLPNIEGAAELGMATVYVDRGHVVSESAAQGSIQTLEQLY